MLKLTRRSFLKSRSRILAGGPSLSAIGDVALEEGTSRRAFLEGGAGAAAGAAIILAGPKVAAIALDGSGSAVAADPKAVVTKATGPAPHEPVAAYVRNAERGEVTVMSGKTETTYRDPALVKRLLDAAR
jgi:hypothetical protein